METEVKRTEVEDRMVTSRTKLFTQQRSFFVILISLLILLVMVFPFGGQSLIERIFKEAIVKKNNVLPNPGFEKGSEAMPSGWTTRSELIVEQ